MKKGILSFLVFAAALSSVLLTFSPAGRRATDYYASVTGSGTACSLASPCSFATACSVTGTSIAAGDTVFLRGGTYPGIYSCSASGTSGNPITFRPYPGETVTFDINQTFVLASPIAASGSSSFSITAPVTVLPIGTAFKVRIDSEEIQVIRTGTLTFDTYLRAQNGTSEAAHSAGATVYAAESQITFTGSDIVFRDFIVTQSTTVMEPRTVAIYNFAPRSKFINNVVYNTGTGFYTSGSTASGSEFYGNVIYNNGGGPSGNLYGIGIYIQNSTTPALVSNNVMFGAFNDIEMQAFTQGAGQTSDITYYRNVTHKGRFLIGGNVASNNITVNENYFYLATLEMGLGFSPNGTATVSNNYVAGRADGLISRYWTSIAYSNNKFYRRQGDGGANNVNLQTDGSAPLSGMTFTANEYATNAQAWVENNSTYRTFAEWQALGKDTAGGFRSGGYTGTDTFYLPNAYQSGRSTVVYYNWSGNATFNLNCTSAGIANGQGFQIKNALNYMAGAIASGTCNSSSPNTSITLSSLTIAQPIAASGLTNTNPSPTFAVFIVEATSSSVGCRRFRDPCP